MPDYKITTEQQDINGRESWHASLYKVRDDGLAALADRDGDTESEAICIAVVESLGDLPPDFPYPERD